MSTPSVSGPTSGPIVGGYRLVTRIGAVRAAAFHFLSPPLGVAIAALWLGESFGWSDVIGSIVVAVGILMVQLARVAPAPTVTRPLAAGPRNA